MSFIDKFLSRARPDALANVVRAQSVDVDAQARQTLNVELLSDISPSIGNRLDTLGGHLGVMPLNRFTFFSMGITPTIEIKEDALTNGNILHVKVTGYLFQNTGANQTITPRGYLGKSGSETLITSETSFTIASGTRRGFTWELTIRQAPYLGMNVLCMEEFRLDGATASTPHIKPVFTAIIDVDYLEEINSMFLRVANGATATMFRVFAGTIEVTPIPVVGLDEHHFVDQPIGADGFDTHILSDFVTTNYGSATAMLIGEANTGVETGRALIRNPRLLNIPKNAQVISAMYDLTLSADFSSNPATLEAYRVLRDWTKTGATWNTYDGTNAWGTTGCGNNATDYDGSALLGSVSFSAADTLGTLKGLALDPAVVQKWIDGSLPYYGILLKMQTDASPANNAYAVHSAEAAVPDLAPILEVVYTLPN